MGGAQAQDRRFKKMVSYRRGIGQPDCYGTPIGTLLPSQMLTFFPQPIFLKFALILRPLHIDSIGLISLGRKSEGGGGVAPETSRLNEPMPGYPSGI